MASLHEQTAASSVRKKCDGRSGRLQVSDGGLFRTADEVVLQVAGKLREVGTVARDADNEVAVALGIRLCGQQRVTVDDVELQMPQLEIAEHADEADQLFSARIAFQTLRRKLDVQQTSGTLVIISVFGVVI